MHEENEVSTKIKVDFFRDRMLRTGHITIKTPVLHLDQI